MKLATLLLLFVSSTTYAAGWTVSAVPTRVDLERGNGFMIHGAFGNVAGCTIADHVYVQISHPQYKELYSTVLAAFMGGKKVQAYISSCAAVTWYTAPSNTFNVMGPGGVLNLMN